MVRVKTRTLRRTLHEASGQSLVEMAMILPLFVVLVLGIVEISYALIDQHVVTRLTREGSNLISRDTTLEDAAKAMKGMASQPLNFGDSTSKAIFSVLKRGETTGTANYDRIILYQRHSVGSCPGSSKLKLAGGGSFGGAPNYEAADSDNNPGLRVTNVPSNLVAVKGGLVYVTEIYSKHLLMTPLERFGIKVPQTLYSIAYF
jgi:TadE-like protein